MRRQTSDVSQKTNLFVALISLLVVFSICSGDAPGGSVTGGRTDPAHCNAIEKGYGRLPLNFEANDGQVDPAVKFLSRGSGYTLFLTSTEAVLDFKRGSSEVVRLKFVGSNPNPKVTGLDKLPGKSHYFLGRDPSKWRTGIANYSKVKVADLYPGIDLIYYGNQRQLEYDWIAGPGADPNAIKFAVESEAEPKLDDQGNLVLDKSGKLILRKPVIYQLSAGARGKISGGYALLENRQVGFHVGKYNPSLPLVIDPVLSYSTFLGGNGHDAGNGIAVDSSGSAYVTGYTYSGNFPTENPYQADHGGGDRDAFIIKLNPAGNELVYSTYLGGSQNDSGSGIAIDSSGCAYVVGNTYSTDFPIANPFQSTHSSGSQDVFITKLNPSGDGLIYSTYFGGSSGNTGSSIAVDSYANVYITGDTSSIDFPQVNSFQAIMGDSNDVFVSKLNPSGNALVYSTFLGGSGFDSGDGIAVDSSGSAYVTGMTASTDFPIENAFQASHGGSYDVFITKMNPSGSALIYSTYLGGNGDDRGRGIGVDSYGCAHVTGQTTSTGFPTKNPFQTNYAGGTQDAFAARLNPSGNTLIYSTYLGGSGEDTGAEVALDVSGNAYITGYARSSYFPTANPIQADYAGGSADVFVTKLYPSGNALIYSTYLGGSAAWDYGQAIAVDSSGCAYVTGITVSGDFPTVDPFQATHGGDWMDAFITKIAPYPRSSCNVDLVSNIAAAISTSGGDGSIQTGYSKAVVDFEPYPPYATAVLSYKYDGITLSEAGVPASPPTTASRIFIDYRSDVPAIPGRPESGTVNINTGIAVVNFRSSTTTINYTLYDSNGDTISEGYGFIGADENFSCFIDQLKSINDTYFDFPESFGIDTRFGALEIVSDQPISVLALRGTNNQRNDFLMTTTPTADLTQPPGDEPIYFPQFVDGGGYTTSLILMNTSDETETGILQILDENGDPFVVNQVGGTSDSSFHYSIPPRGIYRFQTDGSPVNTRAGWARVIPDAGTCTPAGSGVFGYNPEDILLSESGIPSAAATTYASVYVDLTGGHNTGLAIANVEDAAASINFNVYEKDGYPVEGASSEPILLPANGYKAAFADQFIAGLTGAFTGVLNIYSTTPFAALTLRSLVNERHDFLMTSFPIADGYRTAPYPIVFPQIVHGGGYLTQFILIGPVESVDVTLFFYDDGGALRDFIE
jgi:hypothetical protein